MNYRTLSVLYLVFHVMVGVSQVEEWNSLSLNDGLSDLQCFDVFCDSKGYIWVGTRAGINRYDGKDVVKFNRSSGLMSDNVYSFFEDSKGRIWVNNLNGEPVFIENGVVHNRLTDTYLGPLKTDQYKHSMFEDKDGRLYFLNQEPLIGILDGDSVSFLDLTNNEKDDRCQAFTIVEQAGVYIMAYYYGFRVFDSDWNLLKEIKLDGTLNAVRSCVVEDRIYLSYSNHLFCYDLLDLIEVKVPQLINVSLITDLREIDNILHISSTDGLYTFKDGVLSKDGFERFSEMSVSAVDKSKDGRLWVATHEKGIYFESQSLITSSVFSYCHDISYMEQVGEDSIYIGYDSDKLLLAHDNKFQNVNLEPKEGFSILKILMVKNKVWVVSTSFLYDIEAGVSVSFHKRDGVFSEKHDRFYFPYHNGVMHIDYKGMTEKLPMLKEEGKALNTIMGYIDLNQGYKCEIGMDGLVWVGTEEGLFTISDTILSKVDDPDLHGSIIDLEMNDTNLFGINFGIGVFVYNKEKKTAEIIGLKGGLPSANITHMCVHNNDIWVTHGLGISHIRIEDRVLYLVRNYGYAHGIPVGDITFIEYINEQLHFVVDKKTYTLLEDISVNDSLNIIVNSQLLTKYVDEELSVEFDCINYSFGSEMSYEYRLLPKDSSWTSTTNEIISYQYLPANEYTLEIRAKHPLNLESRIVSKRICILNRWYDSYWFFGGLLILLASGIWLLLRIGVLDFNFIRLKVILKTYLTAKELPPLKLKDIKGETRLLKPSDIFYIRASGNYVEYKIKDELITVRNTMSKTEKSLVKMTFLVRVHRSYIANLDRVVGVSQNTIDLGGQSIPYSITYKEPLDNYVGELTS